MKLIAGIFLFGMLTVVGFAQVRVQPLELRERTLDNGLQIVTHRDTSNPVVTVQVWYRVGGKDDPEGKSGFAHMFEHMMFKSTTNMPSESIDRLTEDVGGWNNATTREDLTNYFQVVPSNHLERLLWAEADRMVNLAVTKESFESEREVVKEEYRQRIQNSPYGQLFMYLDSLSFKEHPYKRGVIGDLQQLDAATFEDAAKFYKEYYRPDNAVLIVVGDFEQEKLDGMINKHFGNIKRPEVPIKRVEVKEPQRTKAEVFNKVSRNVPLPAVAVTYAAPASSHKDMASLVLSTAILSRGASSRLYNEIVKKRQLAQQMFLGPDIRTDSSMIVFYAIAAGGKNPKNIEQVLLEEVEKLATDGPTERELRKAKNQLIADLLRERESADGKAFAIGESVIYRGSAAAVNQDVDNLEAVTSEDIKRVLKEYYRKDLRTTIFYSNDNSPRKEISSTNKRGAKDE